MAGEARIQLPDGWESEVYSWLCDHRQARSRTVTIKAVTPKKTTYGQRSMPWDMSRSKSETDTTGVGVKNTHPNWSKTMKVTASCKFNGHDLTDIPVFNPGGWFGKTWLLELGGCYTPLFLVVEADPCPTPSTN